MNEDGGRNWHEVATINADAHKTLRAIIKTAGKETAPKAEQSKETKPTEQPKEKAGFTDDEIKTLTDRGFNRWTKKLSNGKVMDRLYIKPEYLGLELTRYKSGNISSAKFNGEAISNSEARRIEGTKCYVDVATKEVVCDREDLKQAAQEVVDDALKAKSQQEEQAPKEVTKTAKELESATKETQNDADIRFGTVEDAEKAVMEAFGIKPHKKPADTPAVPRKTSTKNSRTKSQEGHDYFATPEPIGYKMVQWLQSKPGQSLLEPSAGDGAIARWMPDNTYNTVVEPSRDLTPKLMRNVAGAKVVESTFENFDLHNKFDGIAMNPPFVHGGKTAVEHVAKAYQHLKNGGRLIAIIPDGPACQKHFDKWFYGDPEAKRKADRGIADGVLMADIHLPSVTFDRAGTSVNTRMVVIDKYADEGTRQTAEAEARGRIDIAADDANELFDRIEDMNMPERLDTSDEKKQASIRKAGQQLTRSKEDLKAEIKEAFPNAKEIKDEGDRMTFTMPNGSHIVVDVKNEILLTDEKLAQAKKDHHIDDNGNVVVEGYAQLHGKDAYMALSQGSRENTGFHEAYHLAEGAVLTDREKAAIKKAIPDAENVPISTPNG